MHQQPLDLPMKRDSLVINKKIFFYYRFLLTRCVIEIPEFLNFWMKHLDPPHWVAFSDRKYFELAAKRTQSLSAVSALLTSSLS